jgi:hypothetical protein
MLPRDGRDFLAVASRQILVSFAVRGIMIIGNQEPIGRINASIRCIR